MVATTQSTEMVEQRLAALEKEFVELWAQVPGLKPCEKDWRCMAGTFPRDELTLEAERLGREWREQANREA